MVKYGDKFSDMLFVEKKPLNFKKGEDLFNKLSELIWKKKVILLGVDLFYWIPNSVCWNKHHWEHYSFVHGFDDEKRVVYVFDDNLSGYGEFEIPEERLIKAISNFPDKPHAYICEISNTLERFELAIDEVKSNARRIVDEITKILPVNFWNLQEKDFIEGHMCDLTATQIFQIINRHIANQLLIQELKDKIHDPSIVNSLISCCIELQKEWDLVKNRLVKIYFSGYKKSLIDDINEKCRSLFLKEISMWEMFLKYID
ncbi:MAG: hypothetical protein ACM3TR_10225 [Caulobacteraceae bacterium]